MKQIRKRLTYANVMSSIAVFLILGGATAVAAKKIGSKQLKANSVTTGKIKRGAVTTAKLKNGLITTSKLADGAVTNPKLLDGAVTSNKVAADFVAPFASRPSRYANVAASGTILANTQGIAQANVAKVGDFYCLSGLNPAPVGGQVTIDYSESGTRVAAQFDLGGGPICPAGTQAFVNPRNTETGNTTEAGFFLVVY